MEGLAPDKIANLNSGFNVRNQPILRGTTRYQSPRGPTIFKIDFLCPAAHEIFAGIREVGHPAPRASSRKGRRAGT